MRIAIISWGSLVWNPGVLALGGPWRVDGPSLGVEFCRWSSRNRVTLALEATAPPQTTLWADSSLGDLHAARENLRLREGPPSIEAIGFCLKDGSAHLSRVAVVHTEILSWLAGKDDLDAAIWTDLPGNFVEKLGAPKGGDLDALFSRLDSLGEAGRADAKEYVLKVPSQIQPPGRAAIESRYGWSQSHPQR